MPYYTLEHVITSKGGWKRPLFTRNRVYRSLEQVSSRIFRLRREYGAENVVCRTKIGDPNTKEVFIRLF